jgi:UDP-N-acetylenolpyruvoylglucosamine reductase
MTKPSLNKTTHLAGSNVLACSECLGITRTKRTLLNEHMSAVHVIIAQWNDLPVLTLARSSNILISDQKNFNFT